MRAFVLEKVFVCVCAYRCRFAMVLKVVSLATFHKGDEYNNNKNDDGDNDDYSKYVVRVCGCNSLVMACHLKSICMICV